MLQPAKALLCPHLFRGGSGPVHKAGPFTVDDALASATWYHEYSWYQVADAKDDQSDQAARQ